MIYYTCTLVNWKYFFNLHKITGNWHEKHRKKCQKVIVFGIFSVIFMSVVILSKLKIFPVYQCACITYRLKIYCMYYKLRLDNKRKTNPLQYELKIYVTCPEKSIQPSSYAIVLYWFSGRVTYIFRSYWTDCFPIVSTLGSWS